MIHLNKDKIISSFLIFFLISSSFFISVCSTNKETKLKKQIHISAAISGDAVVGNEITVVSRLDNNYNKTIRVQLICSGGKCEKIFGKTRFEEQVFTDSANELRWKLKLLDNGQAKLIVEPLDKFDIDVEISNAWSVKILNVGKSYALNTWAQIIGYIYFLAWMISLYPILIKNFNRKSVSGLNLDFVALNTTGYLAYSIYNVFLSSVADFQDAYHEKFPGSDIPVQLNDVLFACHGFVINVLICVQCFFYERGGQVLAKASKAILIAVYSPALVLTLFYFWDGINKYYFISYFSYVKLLMTLCKYIPQAYFNYRRKSTEGWSVIYCFLDFTGGTFSVLQMLLNSINQDDYRNFTGNIGKVGLGFVSISFDILFIIQHYVLYRHMEVLILDNERNNYGSSRGSLQNSNNQNLSSRGSLRNSNQGSNLHNSNLNFESGLKQILKKSSEGIKNEAFDKD